MKAVITSIGEPTTPICKWALERNGFNIVEYNDPTTTLAEKLIQIFYEIDEDFLRVDADLIVNRNMTPELLESLDDKDIWWWQFIAFDWYKMDTNHTMSFIKKQALPALRANAKRFRADLRPETQLSRIGEFYEPRRFKTLENRVMGIHGYGIRDLKPVIKLKSQRGQSHLYDFELTQRMNQL
jgi:hypothetical protein